MCYDLIFPQSLSRYIETHIFIHSKCYCEFISLYHTRISIWHILETALLLSCGVKGVKYTDMMQDKGEIWAAAMDFEDRFKKADIISLRGMRFSLSWLRVHTLLWILSFHGSVSNVKASPLMIPFSKEISWRAAWIWLVVVSGVIDATTYHKRQKGMHRHRI